MQENSLLKFECRVPIEGYEIGTFERLVPDDDKIAVSARGERVTLHGLGRSWVHKRVAFKVLQPKSEQIKCFDLYDETSNPLLDFANAPTTPDGIKALADRFGPLFVGPQFCDFWFKEIEDIQSALTIWGECKSTGNFDPIIREVAMRQWSSGAASTILNETKLAGNSEMLQEALEWEPRLSESIGDYDYGLEANIQLGRAPQGENGARFYIRPRTLTDAIWTQLAQAVGGSEFLKTCVECKKWFTVSAGHGRSDKKYCSNACRMRTYRKGKAEQ